MAFPKRLEYGGHALVWSGDWSAAGARKAIAGAARAGYDYIEIALLDPWQIDVALTKDLLQEYNLRAHASLGLSAATDVTSTDPAIVAKGDELLRKATDVLYALGGSELCGVIYCALGKYPGPASRENRANSVAAMQRLADYAADKGINIDLEVVNRYETNIMNTGLEGLAFLDEVNRPNAFLHLDTYHMNIEENGMAKSVLAAGDRLGYVHIGESHRGYLGTGNVDFASFFAALKQIDYRGPITFESFSSEIVDPKLSNTLCVWRNLWHDSDDLAGKALEFIKQRYGSHHHHHH
uniref:Epimerase n=1 Tax=Methylomonas sp. (strain DH-1) TaxID=1727196 RepID=UPI001B358199|nr:Chain A, Epimerase [Methylomonas sp. DH-1]7CJ4_B Chain B, Epimerase [Methylomonas sp. DH-1]7CJ5_A Chain A, Epimerase [Methylomonas sp. DH-1]7CJ5_B Chain B, Epimerase [Methylomonas sp. DH-1]7CJ6_A Chain A, Epimerase [Methylomonas sp. DH-1]7CJ6_B Chain B, Epimerase [Methylomonas sp. DH-1]7CJ7_A Chain A, Epimerase [Methylomonas sp. DH-1]7CJ7_B Chain B, Epimerase [Methylomonas sp. DH-1]